MKILLRRMYQGSAILAGLCLVLVLVLVTVQILARLIGFLAPGVDDFAVYMLAGCAFLALPYAFKEGAHIRVTVALKRISDPRKRRAMEVVCLGVMTLLCAFLAWSSVMFVWTSYQFNDVATTYFATPLWIPRMVMALGSVVLLVAVLEEFLAVVDGAAPSYEQAESSEI